MTTLFLVRHAETEWNRNGRWQGHTDVPLSDEGREQATLLAQRFIDEGQTFDHIYASDLGRAFETAQRVADALDLPIHPLIELREMNIGGWSGLTVDEIRTRFPHNWANYEQGIDFPRGDHGETMSDFRARAVQVLDNLVQTHPGQHLLVVTHGGTIRAMLYHLEQQTGFVSDIHIGNTSITEIVFNGTQARIIRANDTTHLGIPSTDDGITSQRVL